MISESFISRQMQSRPLFCFAMSFLAGLLVAKAISPPLAACITAFTALTLLAIVFRKKRLLYAAIILFIGLTCGMLRYCLALSHFLPTETHYSVDMIGYISDEPYMNSSTGRVVCRFSLESTDGSPSDLTLRLYLRGDTEALSAIAYGQRLHLKGHIWKPDPVTNPYEFDFGAYILRNGFNGYATAKIEDVSIIGLRHGFPELIISARKAVSRRIDSLFKDAAPMMQALILGDRSQLSNELRQSLNVTGTAHLISISGLHVTVLAAVIVLFLKHIASKRFACILALCILVFYGTLIGFKAPFLRALITFTFICVAPVVGRPSDSITRLSAALLVYLLCRPLDVEDAGFVLSYYATAGILLLSQPLMSLTGVNALRSSWFPRSFISKLFYNATIYLAELLCVSLAAQLATLPFVVSFFGIQSLVSLPFNLVCVPLCMAGFLFGLIALFFSVFIMPVALLLAKIPDLFFSWLTTLMRYGSTLSFLGVRLGRYPTILILLHTVILFAASALSRFRIQLRRLLPLTLIVIAGFASLITYAHAWPFSITFLDAGQADCAVVCNHGHTYMIDVGDTYTPASDYLNATCLNLDGIFLSHPHEDHAGGLLSILESFNPRFIYIPKGWDKQDITSQAVTDGIELARSMGIEIRELSMNDTVVLSDAATLSVLSPDPGNIPEDANNLSLLMKIESNGKTVLFTGDLSAEAEPETIGHVDVLKVAHHGSAKGTNQRFLENITPQIAVISVGENNYGHPSKETLEMLYSTGTTVLMTSSSGAITLTCQHDEWQTTTYLEASDELE